MSCASSPRLTSRSSFASSRLNLHSCVLLKSLVAQSQKCKVSCLYLSDDCCRRVVRKSIARVNTVINQTQKHHIRLHFKGKKYKPLDIRPKKTRAYRRRLEPRFANAKTLRQIKKEQHFPLRKYAVKV